MGYRKHFGRIGAKVGAITVQDPRAGRARIQIDRADGKGFVDVTRPWIVEQDGARRKLQVVAAHDIEGWIAILDHSTTLITQERGDVKITFEASTVATQATCDHKFIDSTKCLKCGWKPETAKGVQ